MNKYILRILKALYGLKNMEIVGCDVAVPFSYALLRFPYRLPDASVKAVARAIEIAEHREAILAWANTGYLGSMLEQHENTLKQAMAAERGLWAVVAEGAKNTVYEMWNIREALLGIGVDLRGAVIVFVTDWRYARNVLKIGCKVFPEAVVEVVSVDGIWEKEHAVFLARSWPRWFLAHLIRDLMFAIGGLELAGAARHDRAIIAKA